jgi:hypothetical protein
MEPGGRRGLDGLSVDVVDAGVVVEEDEGEDEDASDDDEAAEGSGGGGGEGGWTITCATCAIDCCNLIGGGIEGLGGYECTLLLLPFCMFVLISIGSGSSFI